MNTNRVARLGATLLIALISVSCSGRPAPMPTSTPMPLPSEEPTIAASPTRLPPIATSTPEPTTVPPIATPTPHPPTPTATPRPPTVTSTPEPTAERILFPTGATATTVEGYLPANETKIYVMQVAQGQFVEMNAAVGTMGPGLRFSIIGADGIVVKSMGDAHVRTVVPSTQDYYVHLISDVGATHYTMSLLIPVRVRFVTGGTSAQVTGSLAADGVRHYVIRAMAGQRMIVDPWTSQGQVRLVIWGADGQVLLSGRVGPPGGSYDGVLPVSQDYLIAVQADGGSRATYGVDITIPPPL